MDADRAQDRPTRSASVNCTTPPGLRARAAVSKAGATLVSASIPQPFEQVFKAKTLGSGGEG